MDSGDFVALGGDFLAHYASPYYDPVKAHEYYMRTRKLKGREPASTPEQRKKEGVAYAKAQVSAARDADLTAAAKAQEAKLTDLQNKAVAARDKIVEKLMARVEELKAQAEGVRVNQISPTAANKLKAFLEKHNVYRKRKAIDAANKEISTSSAAAKEEIQKIGTDLKDAVAKAREAYAANRQAMVEKYNKDLNTEIENIQNKVR